MADTDVNSKPPRRPRRRPMVRRSWMFLFFVLFMVLSLVFGPRQKSSQNRSPDAPESQKVTERRADGPEVPIRRVALPPAAWVSSPGEPGETPATAAAEDLATGPIHIAALIHSSSGPVAGAEVWVINTHGRRFEPADTASVILAVGRSDAQGEVSFEINRPQGGRFLLLARTDGGWFRSPSSEGRPWTETRMVIDATRAWPRSVHWSGSAPVRGVILPAPDGPSTAAPTPRSWQVIDIPLFPEKTNQTPPLGDGDWDLWIFAEDGNARFSRLASDVSLNLDTPIHQEVSVAPFPAIEQDAAELDVILPGFGEVLVLRLTSAGGIDRSWLDELDWRPITPRITPSNTGVFTLPPGTYRIDTLRPDGIILRGPIVELAPRSRVQATALKTPRHQVQLEVSDLNGRPVEGWVGLRRDADSIRSAAHLRRGFTHHGKFTLEEPPHGTYFVILEATGFRRQVLQLERRDDSPAAELHHIQMVPLEPRHIRLVSETGGSVARWDVAAVDAAGQVRHFVSDADGQIELDNPVLPTVLIPLLGALALPTDSFEWLRDFSGGVLWDPDSTPPSVFVPRTTPQIFEVSTKPPEFAATCRLELVHAGSATAPGLWPKVVLSQLPAGRFEIERWVPGSYRAVASQGSAVSLVDFEIRADRQDVVHLFFDFFPDQK